MLEKFFFFPNSSISDPKYRLQNAKNESGCKLLNALNHPWADSALAIWGIKDFRGTI